MNAVPEEIRTKRGKEKKREKKGKMTGDRSKDERT